jgi:tetratricopeptide (TPR) repeat protein
MKKFIFGILSALLLTTSAQADSWQKHWALAAESSHIKNNELAEKEFSESIRLLEEKEDFSKAYIYTDRARFYALLERYDEALIDVNVALTFQDQLSTSELVKAIVTRIFIYTSLGQNEAALKEHDWLSKVNPNKAEFDYNEDCVIVRNVPECGCYRNFLRILFVADGTCKSADDIHFIGEDICIAYRTIKDCGCGCGGARQKKEESESVKVNPVLRKGKLSKDKFDLLEDVQSEMGERWWDRDPKKEAIENCKYKCEKAAFAANLWCRKMFKNWRCFSMCAIAVEALKDTCKWCCQDGDAYTKCIKPFESVAESVAGAVGNCFDDMD